MSRYRPSARTVAAYVALSKFIYALVILLLMFLNCGYENDLPGTLSTNGRYPSLKNPNWTTSNTSNLHCKFGVEHQLQSGLSV